MNGNTEFKVFHCLLIGQLIGQQAVVSFLDLLQTMVKPELTLLSS